VPAPLPRCMLIMQHAGPHHFLHLDVGWQLQHSCNVGLNHTLAYNILTPTPVPGKRPLQPTTQTKLMLRHSGLPQPYLCPYPILSLPAHCSVHTPPTRCGRSHCCASRRGNCGRCWGCRRRGASSRSSQHCCFHAAGKESAHMMCMR